MLIGLVVEKSCVKSVRSIQSDLAFILLQMIAIQIRVLTVPVMTGSMSSAVRVTKATLVQPVKMLVCLPLMCDTSFSDKPDN